MSTPLPFARTFTNDDLRIHSIGRATLRAWMEAGVVRRVAYGVYEATASPRDELLPSSQVRLAVERGDVPMSTLAAAGHHGLWIPRQIPPQLLSAESRRVVPAEFLQRVEGRLLGSLEWTAMQLALRQPLQGALISIDSALRLGAARDALLGIQDRMKRWAGSKHVAEAVQLADARSESALESWSRGLFVVHHLPMPQLQFKIVLDGIESRCDFAYPDLRIVMEADGEAKLGATLEERKRAEYLWHRRQGRLQKAGFIVLRWGWKEVDPNHSAWATGVRAVLARR